MKVVRLNRMMLGVSVPVAAFCDRVFGASLVDVDDPAATVGADVVVVGRQRLLDNGVYSFAHDVIPRCLKVHLPSLLVAVLPDRFDAVRYAKDLVAYRDACARGVAVVVFELGVWRDGKDAGADEAHVMAEAQRALQVARETMRPLAWLSGAPLHGTL